MPPKRPREDDVAAITSEQREAQATSNQLRNSALKFGVLCKDTIPVNKQLQPSKALSKCNGADIIKKSTIRKNRYLLIFNAQIAPAARGKFGTLSHMDTPNPAMYVDFPTGRLKLLGTLVYPKDKYMILRTASTVVCEDVFESMIVFSRAVWVGTKENNPKEQELPLPASLQQQQLHNGYNFNYGASNKPGDDSKGKRSASKAGKGAHPEEEEDGQDAAGESNQPRKTTTPRAKRKARYDEDDAGDNNDNNVDDDSDEDEDDVMYGDDNSEADDTLAGRAHKAARAYRQVEKAMMDEAMEGDDEQGIVSPPATAAAAAAAASTEPPSRQLSRRAATKRNYKEAEVEEVEVVAEVKDALKAEEKEGDEDDNGGDNSAQQKHVRMSASGRPQSNGASTSKGPATAVKDATDKQPSKVASNPGKKKSDAAPAAKRQRTMKAFMTKPPAKQDTSAADVEEEIIVLDSDNQLSPATKKATMPKSTARAMRLRKAPAIVIDSDDDHNNDDANGSNDNEGSGSGDGGDDEEEDARKAAKGCRQAAEPSSAKARAPAKMFAAKGKPSASAKAAGQKPPDKAAEAPTAAAAAAAAAGSGSSKQVAAKGASCKAAAGGPDAARNTPKRAASKAAQHKLKQESEEDGSGDQDDGNDSDTGSD